MTSYIIVSVEVNLSKLYKHNVILDDLLRIRVSVDWWEVELNCVTECIAVLNFIQSTLLVRIVQSM